MTTPASSDHRRPPKDPYYPEIDVANFTATMPDGRIGQASDWYDVETRLFLRTVHYSCRGLEHLTPEQHYQFVRMTGLAKGYRDDRGSYEVVWVDLAGEAVVAVNMVAKSSPRVLPE